MIPSGFYQSDVVLVNQNMDLTRYIMDIPITSADFSSAYWLGWIYFDNLPTSYHLSSYEFEDGICNFEDVTAQNNYPVGYTCYYDTDTNMIRTKTLADTNNGTKWKDATACWGNWDSSKYARLPNDLDVNTTAYQGYNMNIGIRGTADNGEYVDSIWGFFNPTSPLLTGTFTITMHKHLGNFYTDTQLTLDYDDFENGVFEFTENGITYKLVICAWECLYLRDINTDNSVSNYANTKPTILVSDTYGQQHLLGVMSSPYITNTDFSWYTALGQFGNGFFLWSDGHVTDPSNGGCFYNKNGDNYVVYGGLVGSFDLGNNTIDTGLIYFPEGANFIVVGEHRSDFAIINRIYTIDDIRKTLSLATRYSMTATQQYVNSSNYLYAHVSEENEFLCELVDGSPENVQNELREWQIIGNTIVDNNFDPEDIPPYEPTPPGSDLEELGDSIDIQTPSIGVANNFLTMYALTEAQVSNFGSVLWTSWVEEITPGELTLTKMIDNFTAGFDLLTTTASFDISSVLQFIVSLRVYPFSLANLHITQNAGQVAYIGRGEYGINCGGGQNILKFTESMGYLNAGSLTVPRHFGDWRDHDNTTVMAYLPYCGTVELNPSDVVGRTLVCTYAVDVYTGQCMAIIESYSPEDLGGKHYPIAITHGTIGVSIPVSTTNSGQIAGAFINSAMNIMQIVSGAVTDAAVQVAGAQLAMNSKSMSKQSSAYKDAYVQQQAQEIAFNLGNAGLGVENEALGYLSSKGVGFPTLSGGSGLTSFMEPSSAYIQIRRGLYKTNDQYDHTNGKPSTDARPLSSYIGTGLTICNNVDVSGLTCHEYEKAAIKEMLASGVYL